MINKNDIIEYQLALHIKDKNIVEIVIVDIVPNEIDDVDDDSVAFRRLKGILIKEKLH
jgi:hypothetical protein